MAVTVDVESHEAAGHFAVVAAAAFSFVAVFVDLPLSVVP